MRRILLVANLTLGGQPLLDEVRERVAGGACRFHILVPASHAAMSRGTYTHDESRQAARERLDRMLTTLEELGCEATGEVGDIRAIDATVDALRAADYDEVIVSTLPPGVSRWLRVDLVSRIERVVDVPVTHVVGAPVPVQA